MKLIPKKFTMGKYGELYDLQEVVKYLGKTNSAKLIDFMEKSDWGFIRCWNDKYQAIRVNISFSDFEKFEQLLNAEKAPKSKQAKKTSR